MTRYKDIHPAGGFLQRVLSRIEEARELQRYRNMLLGSFFGCSLACSGLVISLRAFIHGAESSGFLLYFRYLFQDFLLLRESAQAFLFALLETFPVIEFAFMLFALVLFMGLLRLIVHSVDRLGGTKRWHQVLFI
jgi:hypothetical protein